MLTIKELNEIETVFIIIDRNYLSPELANSLIEYFHDKNYEQFVYLEWLLCRWVHLRSNMDHLPKRLKFHISIS